MDQVTPHPTDPEADAAVDSAAAGEPAPEVSLVEDVSIDGMCGVY